MIGKLIVEPGTRAQLADRDPGERLGFHDKAEAEKQLLQLITELSVLHNRLWAESRRALLLVLQGVDCSGKDGSIRSVLTGVNPQGCRIVSFKQPDAGELAHDYLWRVHAVCPARGELGIFNRSHYEDVVVARARELAPKSVWSRRSRHIREFERMLSDEGTTIVKVLLHISRDEQLRRLQERLANPEKTWKFRHGDLDDRARWDAFMAAYEDVITETSTTWAPWHIIPADHNWVRNLALATLLVETLRTMDPRLPPPETGLEELQIT